MNKKLFAVLALVASVFASVASVGCSGEDGRDGLPGRDGLTGRDGIDGDNGVDGRDGVDGKDACTGPDPNFWLILRDFQEAERYYSACKAGADAQYAICLATSEPDDLNCKEFSSCTAYCQNSYHQTYDNCYRFTAWRANKTTMRLCDAKVLIYTPPNETNTLWGTLSGVISEDTDGDGISNFDEYQLLLNPCDTHSYGSCSADAELDGDFDEVPNGKDELPYCNPGDKENVSDCILHLIHNPSDHLAADAQSAVPGYVRKISHTRA